VGTPSLYPEGASSSSCWQHSDSELLEELTKYSSDPDEDSQPRHSIEEEFPKLESVEMSEEARALSDPYS